MDREEKELRARLAKIKAFKVELKQLANKHGFDIKGYDQYDNEDNYARTDYHFVVDGEVYWSETVQEVLKQAFPTTTD